MLQFITNTHCDRSVKNQILDVLEGGCRWIQIRMKDASDEEIRQVVNEVKPKCAETDSFLLLDDRVELCKELELTGVHLGKNDMPPAQARMILGPSAVIGVTVNTIADVMAVRSLDIDYFGIGPFRETVTKDNLAPVLGLSGIANLMQEIGKNEIEIPAVAIGGITTDDVKELMATGVNGIAVSGAIAKANDAVSETQKFIELISK